MSIGKRLMDLARANLTDFREAFGSDRLRDLLDEDERAEVDKEVESVGAKAGRRAREFRDAAEEAWERAYEASQARGHFPGGSADPEADRRNWYRTLELEPGAGLDEVRRAYRRLLKQYHPDKFANEPEKYRAATEVTRRLTEAYNGLTRYLGG